ncbi:MULTISPECIES: Gfo/Idh/MocA family protein [Paenibacillus]|jgi:predicted dehydrogenase|uniref:Gfo/Idh/MocA family protein n=1 Tax=Paenibacillus TaxID=44249 RepID=UPI0004910782|nr:MULTISPECIES: Gfo/Idh/MocA family oxidoreductase [Paenibacillus]MEC2344973.1 Gfo/Idh/MocA family oxidoreductase [Paenibacillus barengoltzii]SMF19147.1 Predicted dehydrogenase [Paenibacillus barengoltzii]
MIRIGKISYWHVHAEDYTKQALEHPETKLAAIWDELPERGQAKAAQYGVPYYASLDEMLAQDDIDAVIVDAPTNMHRDVMVKAAEAGKHIFTEKVIAPTAKEVSDILAAVRKAGVRLMVSLPRLYDGYTQTIDRVLQGGKLGKLTMARVRLSHNGATANWLPEHFFSKEQCGGGALIDLGCHPMYLVRRFLGMPESVSANFGYVTGKEVEDNAVAILRYAEGAIGIVEAGFVNSHSPFSIELHGTEGTLLYGFPDEVPVVRYNGGSEQWEKLELDDRLPYAFSQWVEHIKLGTEATDNIAAAVDLTKLMEASNRSVAEGRPIRIDELAE